MPIYYKHKLVHIHIPRTSGSAIENYFHHLGDMKWSRISWFGTANMNGRWFEFQHLSMPELRTLSNDVFKQYRSFAVARNPYARLLSDYLWRRRLHRQNPNSVIQLFESFDSFLNAIPHNINTNWPDHIHGANKQRANFLLHIRPQYHYVFDNEGNCLVDEILKFEHLSQDMTRFLKQYELSTSWIRPPVLKDPKEFYNLDQLGLVNEIYKRDFLNFSYEMQ